MYPMKNVQALLFISADVELCLRISTPGEGFQNLLRENLYSNQTLLLTSCDCIYLFLQTSMAMEGELVHFSLFRGMFIMEFT